MEMRAAEPALRSAYASVRARSLELVAPLSEEDAVVQSMPEASPAKWHLAHTTWFFETFVLAAFPSYRTPDPAYAVLFNSYYESVGAQYPRERRGMLTRPSLQEIHDYRRHVDAAMDDVLAHCGDEEPVTQTVTLGLAHEQQHQELMLTDILHLLWLNPLQPCYAPEPPPAASPPRDLEWIEGPHGVVEVGDAGDGFTFDNERPRHKVHLNPYAIAGRLVTNAEVRDFVTDGGYRRAQLWLSDGWAYAAREAWQRPLYWHEDLLHSFSLHGTCEIDDHAPAAHLSFYEADAIARWCGHRLPTEAEWEAAVGDLPVRHCLDLRPRADPRDGLREAFGACWQWTASAYLAYPGFRPQQGSLGEYNGKFMANQMVLRGSSCVTPPGHARATYRNFFHPHSRWQFSGLRLAKDC
ncbi:MAG TPA: ergothioneine biosynthesis protein EgtB [Candidatus Binatia bacterium]|nr:ergothioneine biosynthesis protein EgtB [Candidatus Binatia bacterium]